MKWYKKIGGLSFLLLHFVCCLCLVCLFVFFSYSGRYNFVYVGGGERGIKSSQYLNFKEEQWEGVQTVVQQMWVSELLCSSRKYPWGRGVWKAQFLNERMTLKWNFRRGERVQFKKPPFWPQGLRLSDFLDFTICHVMLRAYWRINWGALLRM